MHRFLESHADFVGTGTYQGRLYDLGRYPGAVPSRRHADRIKGELYALNRPAHVLKHLDQYEGPVFRRKRVSINLENKKKTRAWIYLYNHPKDGLKIIHSGDYLKSPPGRSGLPLRNLAQLA